MPGTPYHPPVPAVLPAMSEEPLRLASLPRESTELITLLERLTVDVEHLAASRSDRPAHPPSAPNYHFHFMAKTLMEDGEGRPFPDPESALRHARALATQFTQSGLLYGCTILVARNDEVLFEVPLSRSMN